MRYENIADIYSANLKVRAALTATVGNISPDRGYRSGGRRKMDYSADSRASFNG